jgi:hypothetical protein
MPAAKRSPQPVRGHKTICIPCSQREYEQVVDDPEAFRKFLDQQINATPELFPPEIQRGYRMKDVYTSRKTGWKLRRIQLRNLESYLVRPCFLMPYLSGRTEDVQAPLFSASSPSPTGRSPRSSAARPCTGIAWSGRWGGSAW